VSVDRWLALLLSDRARLLSVDLKSCLPCRPHGNVKPPDEAYSVNAGSLVIPLSALNFTYSLSVNVLWTAAALQTQRELSPWSEVLLEKLISLVVEVLFVLLLLLFVFSLSMWIALQQYIIHIWNIVRQVFGIHLFFFLSSFCFRSLLLNYLLTLIFYVLFKRQVTD
jgi:hypothetical protein